MNTIFIRWQPLVALTLAGLLSGCGGGSEAPETLRTTADVATALRGQSSVVDVLANDVASRGGALTLASIGLQPAHGQAVIESNRVRYTPNPTHLGTDRLSYVARLANGTEAAGELNINTEALMVMRGTVTDGPIANAAVTLTVAGRSYTATANAQGQYQLEAVLQQPGEMLRLEAQGVGDQAQVRLSSIVGDAATLVSVAGVSSDEVAETALGALRVTHVSTAQEALVLRASNGTAPTTQAALQAAQAALDPVQLINLAATIKLVVDGGLALPAGAPDTLALVRSPALAEAFAAANAAALAQMTVQLATDASLGLPAVSPLLPGATSATAFYFFGRGGAGGEAYRVIYRADGTADVTGSYGRKAARWNLDAGELNVRFDTPLVRESISYPLNPVTRQQEEARIESRLHALHFRLISGSSKSAVVQLAETNSRLSNGVIVNPETRSTPFFFQQRELSALDTALRAEDFAPGSRWGGLGFQPMDMTAGESQLLTAGMADLVEFQTAGRASQTITGQQSTWQVSDGVLELRRDDGERLLYRRLQRVTPQEERWLVERLPSGGGPVEMQERLVVRQDPALVFSQASLTGTWLSQMNLLRGDANNRFFVRLLADGQAVTIANVQNPQTGNYALNESSAGSWGLLPDGSMRALRVRQFGTEVPTQSLRDWIPLAREGNKLMVLEWRAVQRAQTIDRTSSTTIFGWRTNIYTVEPNPY